MEHKLKPRCIGWYGYRPDLPDSRDKVVRPQVVRHMPKSIDLRPDMPPVYDQGDIGSCTANAIGAAIQYARRRGGQPDFMPSRLFIYYNERAIERTINEDAGAEIRDGIKCVHKLGACPETDWPYDVARFTAKPPAAAYGNARADLVSAYARVPQTLTSLKGCLARGKPIIFGFAVPESFEGDEIAKTGVLKLDRNEQIVGGHAVLAVGYDDLRGAFLIRNSWGTDWGLAGHFHMDYGFVTDRNCCDDFWSISAVT